MSAATKKWAFVTVAAVVVIAAVVAVAVGVRASRFHTFTAHFASVNGLYRGDPVRVLGVEVGSVASITPKADDVRVTLRVKRDVAIPSSVVAVIVAPNLVSGRFVALTPAYRRGPQIRSGGDIPMDHTAIPVEWDQIKSQLTRLTQAIGPRGADRGAVSTGIDTAAANLAGNGAALHDAITALSRVTATLSEGREDLFGSVRNLQKLTEALSQSHDQLVELNGRLATVSQVLADNTTDLDAAMRNLDSAVAEINTFVATNRASMTDSVARLASVTGILASHDEQVRGLLHSAPTQLSNFYNIYNPLTGSLSGIFGLGMGGNLIDMLCGTMAGNDRPENSAADIEHCVDVLTPVLSNIAVNYPPFLSNPVTGINALPSQIQYQNASVQARAQAGVAERDALTRSQYRNPALGQLLVPFGGQG